jgi:hypothetical protein
MRGMTPRIASAEASVNLGCRSGILPLCNVLPRDPGDFKARQRGTKRCNRRFEELRRRAV